MPDPSPLSSSALALLERMSSGPNVAEPNVYPSSLSGMDHAIGFFSNAATLSEGHGRPDAEVFGVLYGIRHGLELFLKCMCQNRTIDDVLDIVSDGASLDDIFQWLTESNQKDAKTQEKQLLLALSVVRNHLVENIEAPQSWTENIATKGDQRFAVAGLKHLRENPTLKRYQLATTWIPSFRTHNLLTLFKKTKDDLKDMHQAVAANAERCGVGTPSSVDLIEATCELFEHWDPDGHAIRYSNSSGAGSSVLFHGWNAHLPPLELGALGSLASELETTVLAYDNLLEQCYSFATIGNPYPAYDSLLYC